MIKVDRKSMYILQLLVFSLLLHWSHAWKLAMKIPKAANLNGEDGAYQLWTSNNTLNENDDNPMSVLPGQPFKSKDILNWDDRTIKLIKMSFYVGGLEQAYVIFGANPSAFNASRQPVPAAAANLTNWFQCSRIIASSWSDLQNTSLPKICSIHSDYTIETSFSILQSTLDSQSACDNITGWFMVLEPASHNSAIDCDWTPAGTPPQFIFSAGSSVQHVSGFTKADVIAIFVDDCIDDELCHYGNCSQNIEGICDCYGYECTEACADLPCGEDEECVTNPGDDSKFTCEACQYGSVGVRCIERADDGLGAGAIAGIVIGVIVFVALVGVGIWCFYNWRHKEDEMSHKAAVAKDFVRRSVHRLSGRQHQYPRRQLKDENPSPQVKGKSEQLSAESSVVFGEVNPAFEADIPIEPPTPPPDRRYTEFPTRQVTNNNAPTTAVSTSEIKLHENRHMFQKSGRPSSAEVYSRRHYENAPGVPGENQRGREGSAPSEYDRTSTIGSFEKASTMSELSDATSTSGYSDYTGDTPANLPPSEMISKDIVNRHGHHRHRPRSRPRSRASTADPPKTLVAPQTVENQIKYAMERSRSSISSLSSLSSDATHRSDATQRSGEVTKSDALRARYENFGAHQHQTSDTGGRFPRLEAMSYSDIKKQLDADMKKREDRERKQQLEIDRNDDHEAQRIKYHRDVEYETQRNKHRMRQVESLDSGIDAEQSREDRQNDGRLEIVRTRSADQLDKDTEIRFTSREATV